MPEFLEYERELRAKVAEAMGVRADLLRREAQRQASLGLMTRTIDAVFTQQALDLWMAARFNGQ